MNIDGFFLFLVGFFFISSSCLFVVFCFLWKYKRSGDARFDAFYLEGEELIVNSLFKPRYQLDEIASIELSCSRIRKGYRYLGSMRVIQKDGKKTVTIILNQKYITENFLLKVEKKIFY